MHAHHAPFVLTAHGFFNINLQLLGSVTHKKHSIFFMIRQELVDFIILFQMLAASVSFLVILIQFELSNKKIQALSTAIDLEA